MKKLFVLVVSLCITSLFCACGGNTISVKPIDKTENEITVKDTEECYSLTRNNKAQVTISGKNNIKKNANSATSPNNPEEKNYDVVNGKTNGTWVNQKNLKTTSTLNKKAQQKYKNKMNDLLNDLENAD